MATHGRAREITIAALQNRKPFERPGFAMRGILGAAEGTGQMSPEHAQTYKKYVEAGNVFYTVMSYKTPIAWVTHNEVVIIPERKYSNTTTHHQSLCHTYL